MPKVFISYRRADTGDLCDRLATRLRWALGADAIFRDMNTILAGSQYPDVLRQGIETCPVMLALIGPTWMERTGTPPRRRLDDPVDWVRAEIATALRLGHLVIPVLASGAQMPNAFDLPPDLAPLTRFTPVPLRPDPAFADDVRTLVRALRPYTSWSPASWVTLLGGIYLTLSYLFIILSIWGGLGLVGTLAQTPLFDPVSAAFVAVILGAYTGLRALRRHKWGWTAAGALILASGSLTLVPLPDTTLVNFALTLFLMPLGALFCLLAGWFGPRAVRPPDTLQARWTLWHGTLACLLALIVVFQALNWIAMFSGATTVLIAGTYFLSLLALIALMAAAGCVACMRAFIYRRMWWGLGALAFMYGGMLVEILPLLAKFVDPQGAFLGAFVGAYGIFPLGFVLFMAVWLTSYSARTPARMVAGGLAWEQVR